MFKRIFKLFQIARKLSTSGVIDTVNKVHEVPLPVNLFFNFISIGSDTNSYENQNVKLKIGFEELKNMVNKKSKT